MNMHAGALGLVSDRLARAIRPVTPKPFRLWLPENIILVDGPRKGEFWTPEDTPYLLEIADCLDLSHVCNEVTVRKAQQTGVSILALAWCLYLAENAPDNILYGVPGKDALLDTNNGKFQPLIDEWQKVTGKHVIFPTVQKSGSGSTRYEKAIVGGGRINLANANTVMDLSSKTARYGVKDEVSKWSELPNGADPETLFFGRFTAFRRQKSYKIFQLSTPENDSGDDLGDDPLHCRIDRAFIRSDQRYWHIACPECGHWFFQHIDGFLLDEKHPHKSEYGCPGCGHCISESERVIGVRSGHYVPKLPNEGREPGFHVDAFISLMMSYEAIAEDRLETRGRGESGEKDFKNLVLALPHQMRGNAPDHKRLMERRENYKENIIPADGLLFVGSADVQHYGIWVMAIAFAPDRQTWVVTARFFEGMTDNPSTGAWIALDNFYHEEFADEFGNKRKLEALAVDAGDGQRLTQVLEWTRRRYGTYAIKGKPLRGVPAISQPSRTSVTKRGKRKRFGSAMVWPVGTWTLKGEIVGNLHKTGIVSGESVDPPGYCHHGMFLGEEYFLQITAEYFKQDLVNGRLNEGWVPIRRDNHYFDCRVYAAAMAELLGLSGMKADDWSRLRAKYSNIQPDLLTQGNHQSEPSSALKLPKPSKKVGNKTSKEKVNKWAQRK